MTQDMNTTYRHDICNYGTGKLRNCGAGSAAVLLLMVVGMVWTDNMMK